MGRRIEFEREITIEGEHRDRPEFDDSDEIDDERVGGFGDSGFGMFMSGIVFTLASVIWFIVMNR